MPVNLVNKQYSLSIRMHPDGFSLFVHNENNKIISSEQFSQQYLDEQIDLELFFHSLHTSLPEYTSVNLILETDFYTLIPAALFKPENAASFLKLYKPTLPETVEIFHTFYKHTESVLIYAYDKQTIKILQSTFSLITVQHHLHQLIEENEAVEGEQVSLLLRNGQIDCLVCRNSSIQLINSYTYQSVEDIVFHIVNILHHLHFNNETAKITIYRGKNIKISPETVLKKYVQSVNCVEI